MARRAGYATVRRPPRSGRGFALHAFCEITAGRPLGRAHRRFHAGFTIDREGRTAGASCTCPAFRRAGIKEGPCEHMIALRVLHIRELAMLEAARGTEEGKRLIRAETRTLFRRTAGGSETFRLSLEDRAVVARWGQAEPLRMSRQLHDTADEARAAYFAWLDRRADQILYAHATVWTEDGAIAADVTTLLHQSIVGPWDAHLVVDPGQGTARTADADPRDAEALGAAIVASEPLPADELVHDDEPGLLALAKAAGPPAPGRRERAWAGSPVPSNRFL